jgi:hypothetical protein
MTVVTTAWMCGTTFLLTTLAFMWSEVEKRAGCHNVHTYTDQMIFCGATAQICPRPPQVEVSRSNTPARTLNKWSARRRGRYLYNKHKRRKSMPSMRFKPPIPKIERWQGHRDRLLQLRYWVKKLGRESAIVNYVYVNVVRPYKLGQWREKYSVICHFTTSIISCVKHVLSAVGFIAQIV